MIIRQENKQDFAQINTLIETAFLAAEHRDGDEHNLVSRLRNSNGYVPELCLVAEKNGELIGHIMTSIIKIKDNDKEHDSLAFAPISVLPAHQRTGVGKALIQEAISLAKKYNYKSITVLGSPTYYTQFGFEKAEKYNIKIPFENMADYFFVIELTEGTLKNTQGTVEYPAEFFTTK